MSFAKTSVILLATLTFAGLVVSADDPPAEKQFVRTFKVPPNFLEWKTGAADASVHGEHPKAMEILKAFGVSFPEGSSAVFNHLTSQLIVKNVPRNLARVEGLIAVQLAKIPVQIYLTTQVVVFDEKVADDTIECSLMSFEASTDRAPPSKTPEGTRPSWPATAVLTRGQFNAVFSSLGGHVEEMDPGSAEERKKTEYFLASLKARKSVAKPMAILSMPSVTIPNGQSAFIGQTRAIQAEKVGFNLGINPIIGPDGSTLDLSFSPRVGGPETWQESKDDRGHNMKVPVFASGFSMTGPPIITAATIWDGQVVVLAGPAYLPEFLFHPEKQDEAALLARRYKVLVFVTARMITPEGKPVADERRKSIQAPDTEPRLPEWNVNDMPLADAVKDLAALSRECDLWGRGASITVTHPEIAKFSVTLHLKNFTVMNAVMHIAVATDSALTIKDNSYLLVPNP